MSESACEAIWETQYDMKHRPGHPCRQPVCGHFDDVPTHPACEPAIVLAYLVRHGVRLCWVHAAKAKAGKPIVIAGTADDATRLAHEIGRLSEQR